VTWSASDPNGDAVKRYEVKVDGVVAEVDAASTGFAFPAERGRTYEIDVRAVNKAGPSAWVSTTGEIWTSPQPVTDLAAVDDAGDGAAFNAGALAVTWTAPSDTGGVPLQGYQVSVDDGTPQVVTSPEIRISGVSGGSHTVTVVVVNARGATSSPVSVSARTRTVPEQPTIADPADVTTPLQVTFSWQPGATGGARIVGYRYQVDGTSGTHLEGTTASTDLVAAGAAGEELTLVVWAVNAEGESAASAPVTAVVADVAPPPTTPPPTTPPAEPAPPGGDGG
jgi:hypothetical protein